VHGAASGSEAISQSILGISTVGRALAQHFPIMKPEADGGHAVGVDRVHARIAVFHRLLKG